MRMELKAETRTVAVRDAAGAMPASARIAGFTTMMYIADKKVVMPAITSVGKSAPLFLMSK